ncbi:MAG TPA: PIN domain-containing protein [Opitutales bacterium]|nr:PIN domain-containing protein [Opitutales bacterium]
MKTAFDTNYLLRHIMQDDAGQCAIVAKSIADALQAGDPVLITEIVLAETVWTLASYYGLKRVAIAEILTAIANDSAFEMENPDRVRRALSKFKSGKAHFPDYLITTAAEERGAKLKSFDRALEV